MRTIYVFFFIHHRRRLVHVMGVTAYPTGDRVARQAGNLATNGDLDAIKVLVRDRDTKFTCPFDDVLRSDGTRVIRTPVRSPKATAVAERWRAQLVENASSRLQFWGLITP